MLAGTDTGWLHTLLDGFLGAALGSLIAVLVALYVLRKTLAGERERAREEAALAAAETLTLSARNLFMELAQSIGTPSGETRRNQAISNFSGDVALKLPALKITTAPVELAVRLIALTEVAVAYGDFAGRVVDAAAREMAAGPATVFASATVTTEQLRGLEEARPWFRYIEGSLGAFRTGEALPDELPPRPSWLVKRGEHPA